MFQAAVIDAVCHGYACGRESRMHCRPLPWRTVYDEGPRRGAKQANMRSRRCRWRRIPLIDGVSCSIEFGSRAPNRGHESGKPDIQE
jgi:hypothetical protein